MDTLPRNFDTTYTDGSARVTLNGGSFKARDPEDDRLIAEFLAKNKVTKCPPSGLTGNEACRATNELVAKKRREFRKKTKAAK